MKKINQPSNANCFSPRNGEVILKVLRRLYGSLRACFSPRNGEVILKSIGYIGYDLIKKCFSPRNGEVILKYHEQDQYYF